MMYCLFNSNDLNANGYEVTNIEASNPPTPIVNKYQLVRADGEKVTSIYYGKRTIVVSGRINAANRKDLDNKIDTLKSYITGIDNNLDVYIGDITRRFKATCSGLSITKSGYFCTWVLEFACDAFGVDISTTALSLTTPYITNPTADVNTFLGTYNAQPVLDLTLLAVDPSWVSKYLDIQNVALNKRIRITRTWNWFDRIIVNCATKVVSLYAATKSLFDSCDVATGWTSTHTLTVEAANMKEGVGALKQVMGGAALNLDLSKLNFTPTFDLGAATGTVVIPIFIPTPSAGAVQSVSLYTGSDATLAANYAYWTKTTQYDGSAIATNAWNWFAFDLSLAATGSNGTPNRAAIKSVMIRITGTSAAMQLSGVLVDYIAQYKAAVTAATIDYEGIFPEFAPGSGTVTISDELTMRKITYTGNYTKRYL